MIWFWFNLFLHIIMVAANVAWVIVTYRLTRSLFWRTLVTIFMGWQILALIVVHSPWPELAYRPKSLLVAMIIWNNAALVFGAAAFAIYAAVRLYRRLRPRVEKPPATPESPAAPITPDSKLLARRQFLGACAAVTPALFTTGLTIVSMKQIETFRLRRMTLSLPTLPRALDGMTIAHVSDIHVGRITCGRILTDLVATTNDLRADLILLTGDLINYELSDLSDAMALVKSMQCRYGTYTIEGNHDLIEDSGEFRRRLKASGIPYLMNESATVSVRGCPVQLLGIRWSHQRGAELDRIIAGEVHDLMKLRDHDAFPIFLAHHPHAFDAAVRENLPLTLSGHTHGGQLMLTPEFGAGSMLFRYWSGLYKRDNSQMIVSNGVGNMFPLRVNAPAEVVHLTLRCGPAFVG